MNLTQGTNREHIAPEDVAALRTAGVLVEDGRRQRPRWFDGRFLAARDLIREQQYFLTREADLGQAAGSGVAAGLTVAEGAEAQTLRIGAGHGITPAGELVLLQYDLTVRLADIPRAEQFTAKFGLGRLPQPPLRTRTGLFVLALRPVEFTANPIGAYPTSITGQRTVEDGDVIEAAAVVLVPWQDDGASDALDARRGRAARAIFVEGNDRGVSANVLPLAMIALANNTLAWIDAPMVRRELGADRGDLPGLGFAPQALRLAHLLQHQGHVADVVGTTGGRSFPAATHFPALPPAGPLPPGLINPADFTQNYFPAEIAVDFAIIPEDELPALAEESLALPGIDLTAAAETLESTSVLILAPVPRNEWRAVIGRLTTLTRAVPSAAPNLVAARKPLEILQRLRLPRAVIPPLDPTSPSDREWQRLAQLPTLWFVRRRNIAYREDLAGAAVRFAGVSLDRTNDALLGRLDALNLRTNFDGLLSRATPGARSEIIGVLSSPRFTDSPTLTAAALNEFARAETLDQASALGAAATLTSSRTGTGLTRLDSTTDIGASREALAAIANSTTDWRALDTAVAVAPVSEVSNVASTATGTTVRPTTPVITPRPVTGGTVVRPTGGAVGGLATPVGGTVVRPTGGTVAGSTTPLGGSTLATGGLVRPRGAKKTRAKRRTPK
jgi:hypothetical protein